MNRVPRVWIHTAGERLHRGLTPEQYDALLTYNAEVYRGIAHTREWVLQMQELQATFDVMAATP